MEIIHCNKCGTELKVECKIPHLPDYAEKIEEAVAENIKRTRQETLEEIIKNITKIK